MESLLRFVNLPVEACRAEVNVLSQLVLKLLDTYLLLEQPINRTLDRLT